MLVFTRKAGEAIVIGNGIEVRIVRVGKDGVRIGITAPPEVAVHRREVYEAIQAANLSAATSDPEGVAKLASAFRRRSGRTEG